MGAAHAQTAPSAPTNLTATHISATTVRLDWNTPTSSGGVLIHKFQYRRISEGGSYGSWTDIPDSSRAITAEVTVPSGTIIYMFQLRAYNDLHRTGPASNTATAVNPFDATLRALSFSDLALSPAFATSTTSYSGGTVANSVSRITVTATKNRPMATIEYLDGSDNTLTDADSGTTEFQVDIDAGENTVKVKVTGSNGTSTKTYTVDVFRIAAPVACSAASMQNRIWTGQMTAGSGALNGFSDGSFGYLDNETITYKGTSYTVNSVVRGSLFRDWSSCFTNYKAG